MQIDFTLLTAKFSIIRKMEPMLKSLYSHNSSSSNFSTSVSPFPVIVYNFLIFSPFLNIFHEILLFSAYVSSSYSNSRGTIFRAPLLREKQFRMNLNSVKVWYYSGTLRHYRFLQRSFHKQPKSISKNDILISINHRKRNRESKGQYSLITYRLRRGRESPV